MLEQAIQANTEALHQLISLLSSREAINAVSAPVVNLTSDTLPVLNIVPQKTPAANNTAQVVVAEPVKTEPVKEPETIIAYDDVKAAIIKLSQAKGAQTVRDVLSRFGVTKAPDLLPTQYAAVVEKVNSVIDGGAV